MRRYFASEPRLSREELERQAQEAIDARVSMGRPPDEEFLPIRERLSEIDAALAARTPAPPPPVAEPMRIHQVQLPPEPPAERPAKPRSAKRREPVAARSSSN